MFLFERGGKDGVMMLLLDGMASLNSIICTNVTEQMQEYSCLLLFLTIISSEQRE